MRRRTVLQGCISYRENGMRGDWAIARITRAKSEGRAHAWTRRKGRRKGEARTKAKSERRNGGIVPVKQVDTFKTKKKKKKKTEVDSFLRLAAGIIGVCPPAEMIR